MLGRQSFQSEAIGALAPGRQDEATIREPGDLPSVVSTRQTWVGVYLWMIQKTAQVFWSSLAPTAGHARIFWC